MTRACVHCGTKLDEGCFICPKCGTMVAPPAVTAGAPPEAKRGSGLSGIGGWLILVAAGLVIAPVACVVSMVIDYRMLTGRDDLNTLFLRSPVGHVFAVEIGIGAVMIAALLGLNGLFFAKKRSFPKWMIAFLVFQLVAAAGLELMIVAAAPAVNGAAMMMGLARPLLAALIWIPYFQVSRRVKATFVNP